MIRLSGRSTWSENEVVEVYAQSKIDVFDAILILTHLKLNRMS